MGADTNLHLIAFSPQPSVADFLKKILEKAGFSASACWATPDHLEAAVLQTPPDAVVCEVGFPFAQQWRALTDARRRPALRNVPFVIVTGEPEELFRRVGVRAALSIFSRPDNSADVRAAVEAAVAPAALPRLPRHRSGTFVAAALEDSTL
jgi:DNA-binding response OmpR family regulator